MVAVLFEKYIVAVWFWWGVKVAVVKVWLNPAQFLLGTKDLVAVIPQKTIVIVDCTLLAVLL